MLRNVTLCALLVFVATHAFAGDEYTPRRSIQSGQEMVVYYFTTSYCAFCRDPAVIDAVVRAKRILADVAAAEDKLFSFVGVATDHDVKTGLEVLSKVGPFDQISVGGGVFNDVNTAVRIQGRGQPSQCKLAYPMLLVAERTLSADVDRFHVSTLWSRHCVVGRGIVAWVNDGAPLPLFVPGND